MNTAENGDAGRSIRIANGAGFWGDSLDAPLRLAQSGNIDYLTLEYLAELTLSILAHQKSKRPDAGFVTDVPIVVESIVESFREPSNLKLVTNGGGMNPQACAKSVAKVLADNGLSHLRIGACAGDDLISSDAKIGFQELLDAGEEFLHFESGQPLGGLKDEIVSANVYLGYAGIQKALQEESSIVLTGRIADASLVVGPLAHEFDWDSSDFERLGKATAAGHLIECGAQATGGIYSNWNPEIDLSHVGYPIAEVDVSGDCVITKPENSGGVVNCETIAEQLIYEIGDPRRYMTPDVVADFSQIRLEQIGKDRVAVAHGTGTAAPETLKVSMAYRSGYAVSGMIVLAGPDAVRNAKAAAKMVEKRVKNAGFDLEQFHYEILGNGGSMPGAPADTSPWEVVLRVSAKSPKRDACDRLARELAPLVTSGPPAVTGYTGARARAHPVLAYWPTTITRDKIHHTVVTKTAAEWLQ